MKTNNILKRLSTLLILVLVLSLGFSACSKDKDPEPKEEKITLDGKWIGTDAATEYYFNEKLVKANDEVGWGYAIFSPNKLTIKQGEEIHEYLVTVNETNLVIKGEAGPVSLEYLISGNKLKLMTTSEQTGDVGGIDYNKIKIVMNFVKDK